MGRHINLFQYEDHFSLNIDGVNHQISEPVGFNKADITLKRDEKYYGANYSFIDDDFPLKFDQFSGYKLIENWYDRHGSDAIIYFSWNYVHQGEVHVKYQGRINLNTYVKDDTYITATVEKVTFESLYRTRFDTKVNLNANETLSGEPAEPLLAKSTELHSKGLLKKFESNITGLSAERQLARYCYIQMDTTNQNVTEIDEVFAMPMDMSGIDPITEERFFFEATEAGSYQFISKASFGFKVRRAFYNDMGTWKISPRVLIKSGSDVREIVFDQFRQSGRLNEAFLNVQAVVDFDITLNLVVGDKVYYDFYAEMERAGTSYWYEVYNYQCKVELFAKTIAPPSFANLYRYFDALNKTLELVTGRKNALRSSYFGEGGCGWNFAITNGYQLRNFEISERPVQVSLKMLIEGMQAIPNIGVAFAIDEDGSDVLYVEPMEAFYQPKVISHIEDVFDYSEQTAKEFIFNEIEVGYNKFPDQDALTLDEFNTYHNYLTSVTSVKNKLSIKTDFITSGYEIERNRREQFKVNPSASLSNDDELFLICLSDDGSKAERSENFSQVTELYSADTAYNLRVTPKRMLFAWGHFINSSLFFKPQGDVIKNTFVKNNGKLITQMKPESCDEKEPKNPDGSNAVVVESAHLKIKDLSNGERVFAPVWVNFKANMKWDEYEEIAKSLTNLDHSNLYGYVTFRDIKGLLQGGYPYTLTYSPESETCTLKLLKKMLTLPNGIDVSSGCDNYAAWSFSQFETTAGDEPIEDCLFDDFN